MFIKMPAFAGIFLQKRIEIPGKNESKKAGKKIYICDKKILAKTRFDLHNFLAKIIKFNNKQRRSNHESKMGLYFR